MVRNTTEIRFATLEQRIDNLARSLHSQIEITVQLRSDHDLTLHRLADALSTDNGDVALSAVLASIEPARPD